MKGFLEVFQSELLLSEEDKRTGFWQIDEAHFAYPLTPMFASFTLPAITTGSKLAYANLNAPIVQFRAKLSDGRYYDETIMHAGELKKRQQLYMETIETHLPYLRQQLQSYVEDELLPTYSRFDAYRQQRLTLQEAKQIIQELYDFYQMVWQRHFEIISPLDGFEQMENLYSQLTGVKSSTAFYQLLSGVMNKSLETDRELWKLAEYAKGSEVLRGFFVESSDGYTQQLSASEEGREFLSLLQNVLEIYGYRSSNSHEFVDETWVENPEYALRIIATYMQKDYDFDFIYAQTVKQREEQAAHSIALMPDGELKQKFLQYYEWALDGWSVKEDHHFYIDAMLPAKTRLLLLHISQLLVDQAVLLSKNDIFYLYLDELQEVLTAPVSQISKVKQRKHEHEENKKKQVPLFYGTPPQDFVEPGIEQDNLDQNEGVNSLKGVAASQGKYRGTVKVIHDPADFLKVQKGDVLVCKTTTPPWTVLFSIVGAIVTDAGGILQHTATVAREYKIPCVVGTKVATSVLKDGDIVIVDGTRGVIEIDQP